MNNFKFVCPNCKKESTVVGVQHDVTVFYEYDFYSESWEERDKSDGDLVAYYCIYCDEDLPAEMQKKIWEAIYGNLLKEG